MEAPGAFGCTAENCAFRDHAGQLGALDATVIGVSAQPLEQQREFAERERMPYPLLNDSGFALAELLDLPTFEVAGVRRYRRLTFIARAGTIDKVFYPVFPPDEHAAEVLAWLASRRTTGMSSGATAAGPRAVRCRGGSSSAALRPHPRSLPGTRSA